MKLTCPSCGATASLEAYMADADWRDAVMAAATLPSDCGSLALRYVGMFRPASRALSPDRAARLIREVCDMIVAGVDFDRQHIDAPSHVWRAALIEMIDAPNVKRPLKNHHYLLRIVQSKLGERVDANQAEKHKTRRGEARVNSGPQRMSDVLARQVPASLPKLPEDERECRLSAARELLISEGFNERFISAPLVEQKAREIYAEEVTQ